MHFLFHFSALSVLPFWVAMIVFLRARPTSRLVSTPWIVLPAALCYVALAAPHARDLFSVFASPSPESRAVAMGQPWAASMFWAYAGAFDLFVGRWIHLDATVRGSAMRSSLLCSPSASCWVPASRSTWSCAHSTRGDLPTIRLFPRGTAGERFYVALLQR
jgi:hypothetical protein